MPRGRTQRRSGLLLLLMGAGALFVLQPQAAAQQGPGFLFGRPHVSLGIAFGYARPSENSELFDFARKELTIERGDFSAPVVQGELAVRATEKVDVAVGLGWTARSLRSESRPFIGTDGLPIEQTTKFKRVPLTLAVKTYLIERGRSLGRFAWVPSKWSPYLGAGVGAAWYQFEQEGEFVDCETLDVFRDYFLSEGWAPTAQLRAGADLSLATRIVLTGEGRYSWGSTPLSSDFVGFDDLDLAGFQATAGISLRF